MVLKLCVLGVCLQEFATKDKMIKNRNIRKRLKIRAHPENMGITVRLQPATLQFYRVL